MAASLLATRHNHRCAKVVPPRHIASKHTPVMTRLLIALLVAFAVIAGGFVFCAFSERKLLAEMRQGLRDAKAAGTLPPELQSIDVETMPLADVGVPVSRSLMRQAAIANWLENLAVILIPLVIGTCVLAAVLGGRVN
jgi:hypothetical protein